MTPAEKLHALRDQLGVESLSPHLHAHRLGLPSYEVRAVDKHQWGQRFRWFEIVETRPRLADKVLAHTDAIIGSGPEQDAEALRQQRNADRMVDGLRARR
ncbi:hypothetical protein RM530_03815 [Algiphilus sp. W345]|uniref:Uncharacterized protein n=1 Tax=Banduia mediterranea TaxID=3075609 RepID=A0ABU2WF44_9GAMM|nr:hypothetical protein [Algiphilus sp. W345]MDT0496492.1 hypothetical protein [Algiphilus sp. W345]